MTVANVAGLYVPQGRNSSDEYWPSAGSYHQTPFDDLRQDQGRPPILRVGHAQAEDGISVIESLAPQGDSAPLHVHRTEDEVFHVFEGEFRFKVGEQEFAVGEDETLLAPKGVPHTYVVESGQGRWLVVTARGYFERFVRSFGRPAERAELPEPSPPPTPQQAEALAAAAREYEIELVGPPLH